MKLEIGKRYVLRDGSTTGPLRQNNLHPFPFFCDELSYSWKEDGGYINDFVHPRDIVSEYIEPQSQSQPSPAIDPGEGYRLLEPGELVQEGDEFKVNRGWIPTGNPGDTVHMNHYRRRLPQPSPPNEIQQLREQCNRQAATIEEQAQRLQSVTYARAQKDAEIQQLREQCKRQEAVIREQDKRYAETQAMSAWQQTDIDTLTQRNQNQLKVIDGLKDELAEKAQQLDAMHAMRDVLIDQVAKLEAQAKPLQWERRLPTQEECDTCYILELLRDNYVVLWEPKEPNSPEDFTDHICILPAILPAAEPPQPVIERLWMVRGDDMQWRDEWLPDGEEPKQFFEFRQTVETRENPQ
jgi:uncharacterized coiled-coil protein SlyX